MGFQSRARGELVKVDVKDRLAERHTTRAALLNPCSCTVTILRGVVTCVRVCVSVYSDV